MLGKNNFWRKTNKTQLKKYQVLSGAFLQYFQDFPHFCLQYFYMLFSKTLLASLHTDKIHLLKENLELPEVHKSHNMKSGDIFI